MKNFQKSFEYHLNRQPDSTAILNSGHSISYDELANEIKAVCKYFDENQIERLAIAVTNSPAYICIDLASVFLQTVNIVVPHFFTKEQVMHLLDNSGADAAIVDTEVHFGAKFYNKVIQSSQQINIFGKTHWLIKFKPVRHQKMLPADTLKISYTSGTTGQPKGVVICSPEVDKVVFSLLTRLNASAEDRHISVLPYSLLLENIAGIYTVLAAGGLCIVPSLAELGFSGSSSMDISKFIKTVVDYQPTTMITVPQLAKAFVIGTEQSGIKHKSLRFIAVGGAPLSDSITKKAQQMGLPLHQGYGLTESCSVVSLNTDQENKHGSVGKPLDHVVVTISDDGEIQVSGALCAGYIDNDTGQHHKSWKTGDLGYLDEDGFLYITGRKRTSFCTAYGRNVSPEWVESELIAHPIINQAVIYGEGKTFNIAIVDTRGPVSDDELDIAVATTNKRLPDYAQIGRYIKADESYSVANGQLSISGIIQRTRIINDYRNKIDCLYQ